MIEIRDLFEAAEAQCGGERRHDQSATKSRCQFDRRLRERSDVSRNRLLHRFRCDPHVFKGIVLAVMGDPPVGRPKLPDQLKPLFENSLIVGERHMERQIFALVVAAPAGEIDAASREQVERRPLLRHANGMMQRQHRHRRREPDPGRIRGDIGQYEVRARQDAERIEVMLANPGRMHAEFVGVQRLGGNVGDELVRRARIVLVVIVAQREVTKIHVSLPGGSLARPRKTAAE